MFTDYNVYVCRKCMFEKYCNSLTVEYIVLLGVLHCKQAASKRAGLAMVECSLASKGGAEQTSFKV